MIITIIHVSAIVLVVADLLCLIASRRMLRRLRLASGWGWAVVRPDGSVLTHEALEKSFRTTIKALMVSIPYFLLVLFADYLGLRPGRELQGHLIFFIMGLILTIPALFFNRRYAAVFNKVIRNELVAAPSGDIAARQRNEWLPNETPSAKSNSYKRRRKLTFYDDPESMFDLFLSYRRTVNAESVRRIAESLLARKVHVWFDDYALSSTNLRSDYELQKAIDDGIERSPGGVIFETPDYLRSRFCIYEKNQLERKFPPSTGRLMSASSLTSEREERIADKIARFARFGSSPMEHRPSSAQRKGIPFRDEKAGYVIDSGGWRVKHNGRGFLAGNYIGPDFVWEGGENVMAFHIDIGPSMSCPRERLGDWWHGDRAAITQHAIAHLWSGGPPSDTSERELWWAGYRFAQTYSKLTRASIRGSHLLVLGNSYHYALTYWRLGGWNRRYSIVATDPLSGVPVEIAIVFKFMSTFEDLCGHTYCMDQLVHSLKPL